MSLPYIPGWWDEISKNATGLASQLPRQIQPDAFAKRQLEEMIRQNPMVLEQMSNMDAGTRQLLEQTIGFRNQSPISQLPVGAERQMREMKQKLISDTMATPEGAEEFRAGVTGTQTGAQRKKQALDIQGAEQDIQFKKLNFEKLSDDLNIGKLLNAEKERALKKLQEYRANNKIDPIGLVDRIATNRATASDLELFSVIQNEPGMGEALNSMLEFRKIQDQQRNNLYLRTASMQDDFLRLAMGTVNNAAQEYNRASSVVNDVVSKAALSKISVEEALSTDPMRRAMYDEAVIVRDEAKRRLDMYRPLVQKGFEKFGIKFPESSSSSQTGAAASAPAVTDPELELAKQAISAGTPRAAVARKYKQRTGKDLPL